MSVKSGLVFVNVSGLNANPSFPPLDHHMKIYVAFTYVSAAEYLGVGDMVTDLSHYPPTEGDIANIKDTIARICPKSRSKAVITNMFPIS